jgi:hypothetical protein
VDYSSLAAGTGDISANMDYNPRNSIQKKQSNPPANYKDTRQRIENIFSLLEGHPSCYLFIAPLDPTHPKFAEIQNGFINMNTIKNNFRQCRYSTTFQLSHDIRKMWTQGFKLYERDPETYSKVQDI